MTETIGVKSAYWFSSLQLELWLIVRLAVWKQKKKGEDDLEQDTVLQAVNFRDTFTRRCTHTSVIHSTDTAAVFEHGS